MLTTREKFVDFWAPRIGDEAAGLRWRSAVLNLWAYLLNLVWIPCVIAGAKIPLVPLLAVGLLTAIAAVTLLVFGSLQLRAANKAAGRVLGLKLGFGHISPPPRTRDRYEQWCRQHGVTPYAAGSSDADTKVDS